MSQPLDTVSTSAKNIHLQNILNILGIHFIEAPFEAEAQCAALEAMGLADGVVTEDSDVFLFGARKVYRGVFQNSIKMYWMGNVEEKLMLNR
jgi:DNA excision repair protein ERCC-5